MCVMDPVCVYVTGPLCVCNDPCACVFQSRDKAWVSSMAVTTGDAWAYVADQDGSVPVYDIEEYGLQGPEPQTPRSR